MDVPSQVDIVVMGGGPSGSLSAGLLAKKGYNVALLEKATHPRPVVGESILPHFWRFADMIGASEKLAEQNFIVKSGGIVRWGDQARLLQFKDFGHSRPPIHADRDVFDKIMIDAAQDCGAKIFENHTVLKVDLSDADKKVVHYRRTGERGTESTITARYIVDCTGQQALVAKQFGFREFDPDLKFSAMWGYYDSSDYLDEEGNRRNFSERYATKPVTALQSTGQWGWSWQIILKDSVSVGFIMPKDKLLEFRNLPGDREDKFKTLVDQTPLLGSLMDGADYSGGEVNAIRNYAYKPVKLALNGCYLVGDSAAFVDPINSGGVTFGMFAAVLAAWAIDSSLRNPARADHYEKSFELQYRNRLDMFRLIGLPGDTPLTEEQLEAMTQGLKFYSEQEMQLALTTATLANRSNRLESLMARLNVAPNTIYKDMDLSHII